MNIFNTFRMKIIIDKIGNKLIENDLSEVFNFGIKSLFLRPKIIIQFVKLKFKKVKYFSIFRKFY